MHLGQLFGGSGIRITVLKLFNVVTQYKITIHIKKKVVALPCIGKVTATQAIEPIEADTLLN